MKKSLRGDSSISFWFDRWTEHSRSPRWIVSTFRWRVERDAQPIKSRKRFLASSLLELRDGFVAIHNHARVAGLVDFAERHPQLHPDSDVFRFDIGDLRGQSRAVF